MYLSNIPRTFSKSNYLPLDIQMNSQKMSDEPNQNIVFFKSVTNIFYNTLMYTLLKAYSKNEQSHFCVR